MPQGRFSRAESESTHFRLLQSIADRQRAYDIQEVKLQEALRLIKQYIGSEHTPQNEALHDAVGLVVEFARTHDHLMR